MSLVIFSQIIGFYFLSSIGHIAIPPNNFTDDFARNVHSNSTFIQGKIVLLDTTNTKFVGTWELVAETPYDRKEIFEFTIRKYSELVGYTGFFKSLGGMSFVSDIKMGNYILRCKFSPIGMRGKVVNAVFFLVEKDKLIGGWSPEVLQFKNGKIGYIFSGNASIIDYVNITGTRKKQE